MASFREIIETMDLQKVAPPTIPAPVLEVASRLGLTVTLTSPSVPEQYEVLRSGAPSGYIHVRHGEMSVSYPDAGGEHLHSGSVDGFGAFTDHERETKMLFALGLIAARMMSS